MRNKLFALLLCLTLLLSSVTAVHADGAVYTVAEVESLCDGIIAYKGGGYGAQGWINSGLRNSAGVSAEFYIIALSQRGNYDFSAYESALLNYLDNNEVYAATSREKYALALSAAGSTDAYIEQTADEAIGGLGLMSLVFGLHLLNNGYSSALYSTDGLVGEILSYQLSDGGWAVIGSYGDADVTAMTLQALAPHYGRRSDVRVAVDAALSLLSDMQQDSGAYKGMGVENCESTAQVLAALSDLGIDAQYDSRFIKNGHTVLDGMLGFYNGDGSFAHVGSGFNETATMEAFYAMVAYLRMCCGRGPLYVLDHATHTKPDNSGKSATSGNSGGNASAKSGTNNHSGGTGTTKPAAGNYHNSASSGGSNQTASPNGGQPQSENAPEMITIDGRRYVTATTAAGQAVTVAVEETQPAATQAQTQAERPTYGGFQPSATADTARATADLAAPQNHGGYKGYAIAGVLLIAGGACLVLFLLKKRSKKHYLAVGIIAAGAVLFILLTNFQSKESYTQSAAANGDLTVTMSIRCDTITGREKVNAYVPDDGVILPETEFTISQGDTAYDVLLQASKQYEIAVDNHGAQGAAYIAGIHYLYEFDYGDLSGWMYRVNGAFPDVGCQSCYLDDGDVIEWLYTTNIGKDLTQ